MTETAFHLEEFLRVGETIPGSDQHVEHARATLAELRAGADEATVED